jgi:hypothetical protein
MALSPVDRRRLGLDLEDTPEPFVDPAMTDPAGEFIPGSHSQLSPPVREANLKLVLSGTDKTTAPKIRALTNELLAGNLANADWALKQLFATNPKEALKVYLELCEFTMPKLKAVAVAMDDRSENPKALGFAQLQAMLQG